MIGAKYKLFSAEPKASKGPGTRTEDVAKLWGRYPAGTSLGSG